MGRRGPAPTPTEVLKLRGSWRGVAREKEGEVEAVPGRPVCPRWINASAKRVWKDLIPLLDQMRVLSRVDRNALTRYCQLFSRWRAAEEFIQKNGDTYPVRETVIVDGKEVERVVGFKLFPQVKLAADLAVQLGRIEDRFGMSPSSRSYIGAPARKESETNPLAHDDVTRIRLFPKKKEARTP